MEFLDETACVRKQLLVLSRHDAQEGEYIGGSGYELEVRANAAVKMISPLALTNK